MTEALFRESNPILPKPLALILATVLIATFCVMAVMYLFGDTGMPVWIPVVSALIFAIAIVLSLTAKMELEISQDAVSVRYMTKTHVFPAEEILDKRCGDIDAIRNYGRWNIKGVKHRLFSRVGEEEGVALKLKGKRVVVISVSDSETAFNLIPTEEKRWRVRFIGLGYRLSVTPRNGRSS